MASSGDPTDDQHRLSLVEWSRRAALFSIGAAAAGFVAFGPHSSSDVPRNRIVLDYWEKWTGAEAKAMSRLVDRFNESQNTIFVRYLTISSIDQKAMIAIAGGAPPDVVGLWSFNIQAFAEAGAILPLDTLANAKGINQEQYARAVWPLMRNKGHLYSLISTCGTIALYINDDRLAQAGLQGVEDPKTIGELDELSSALYERNQSGEIERVGFIHTDPGWWSWIWGYHFGGKFLDDTGETALASTPHNFEAYHWVQSYPKNYGSHDLLKFQSGVGFYGTAQAPFLTGQVALTVQGPWMANLIETFQPDLNYHAIPMPVSAGYLDPNEPVGLLDGDVLVIPRGARNPEASFEFISWLQQPAQLEFLASAHGKNSPLRSVSPGFIDNHPNRSISTHNQIAESKRAFGFPKTRIWPRYVAEFDAAFQRLWLLQDTPESSLAMVNRRAQFAIDEAAEHRRRRQL